MFVRSSEDREIEIPNELCSLSRTLSNLIEHFGCAMTVDDGKPLKVDIGSATLETIVRYLVHQHATPQKDRSRASPTCPKHERKITGWDTEFINGLSDDPNGYPPFFNAINFLDIPCLLDLFAEGFANKYITCATPDVLARAMNVNKQ